MSIHGKEGSFFKVHPCGADGESWNDELVHLKCVRMENITGITKYPKAKILLIVLSLMDFVHSGYCDPPRRRRRRCRCRFF